MCHTPPPFILLMRLIMIIAPLVDSHSIWSEISNAIDVFRLSKRRLLNEISHYLEKANTIDYVVIKRRQIRTLRLKSSIVMFKDAEIHKNKLNYQLIYALNITRADELSKLELRDQTCWY